MASSVPFGSVVFGLTAYRMLPALYAASRSAVGHRTLLAHPSRSKARMSKAEESSWPLRTPWRADDG